MWTLSTDAYLLTFYYRLSHLRISNVSIRDSLSASRDDGSVISKYHVGCWRRDYRIIVAVEGKKEVRTMEWWMIVVLVVLAPVILFPAAFVWYLNIGGMVAAVKEARARKAAEARETRQAAKAGRTLTR